jgi:TonB family protein
MQHSHKDESSPTLPRLGAALALDLTFFLLLALHLLALHPVAPGQQNATEDQVKAAYLLNFAKLAEWPRSALPEGPSPLVIGVSGGDEEFLAILKGVVAGKIIGTHPVEVKTVKSEEDMKSCHVIFFRASERKHIQATIETLPETGLLFVGEDESFLRQGGMINLVRDQGSVRFEVNADALDRSEIHFSSKILALAKAGSAPSHTTPSNVPGDLPRVEGTRRVEHTVPPDYPELAQRMKLTGTVQVEAVVKPDGTVKEVKVVGGHPLLADALVRAVRQWKYQPAAKETVESVKFSFVPQ